MTWGAGNVENVLFRDQGEASIDLTEVWIRGCKSMVQI